MSVSGQCCQVRNGARVQAVLTMTIGLTQNDGGKSEGEKVNIPIVVEE